MTGALVKEFWRRFRRHRLGLIGTGVVFLLVIVCLAAPLLYPY
ncbi:MAG: ABC transporter permease, partial [Deltaproteobacteria bacterium]|nr:ABC transporter permease [Deltaproteobacteria bacterium]